MQTAQSALCDMARGTEWKQSMVDPKAALNMTANPKITIKNLRRLQ